MQKLLNPSQIKKMVICKNKIHYKQIYEHEIEAHKSYIKQEIHHKLSKSLICKKKYIH
jgi:hypothetical protein